LSRFADSATASAQVDFSWDLVVRGKRDNTKQISAVVVMLVQALAVTTLCPTVD
jgi:hypothetical protein